MNILQKIPTKAISYSILVILSLITVFHLLILMGVIPYENVWGGRLESQNQMVVMESISLLINLVILWVVAMKAGLMKNRLQSKLMKAFLLAFGLLFILNTLGNLLSLSQLEAIIFTPLTLLLSVLFFLLANRKTVKLGEG